MSKTAMGAIERRQREHRHDRRQVTVGVTDELPEGKRNTGCLGLAAPIVTGKIRIPRRNQ